MFHWMLVAPQMLKSVIPVEDSFFNKEMRTFSRVRTHQYTSETFNTGLWRINTIPASTSPRIVVLATNKTCGAFPWQVSVFYVLWNIMFSKGLFITMSKRTCFKFQPIFPHFVSSILADRRTQRPISLPPVIASAISFIVFVDYMYILSFFCYCTVGQTGSISSLRNLHLSKYVLRFSVLLQVRQKCLCWISLPL